MKKILGISVILSNLLLASPYSDAEIVLKETFKTDFNCSEKGCSSKNIIIDDINNKITAKSIDFTFYNDLEFSYNKEKEIVKIKKECSGDLICENQKIEVLPSKFLSKIISQSKKIETINLGIVDKLTGKKTFIGRLSFESKNKIKDITNIENIKLSDLIFGISISGENIKSEENINILKNINTILPNENIKTFDKKTGQIIVKKDFVKSELNNKIKTMYIKISEMINKEQINDFKLSLETLKENDNLNLDFSFFINNHETGELNLNIKSHLKEAIKNIEAISKMKDNGMFILGTLSNNFIIDKISLEFKQNKINEIHNTLLKDKDYLKNYNSLTKMINENKNEFSFGDKFIYELFGIQHKEGKITINNKNGLAGLQALSAIENDTLIEKSIEYK